MLWLFGTRALWHGGGGLVPLSTAAFPFALLLIGNHDLAKGLAIGTFPGCSSEQIETETGGACPSNTGSRFWFSLLSACAAYLSGMSGFGGSSTVGISLSTTGLETGSACGMGIDHALPTVTGWE